MRIDETDYEEERPFAGVADEFLGPLSDGDDVAARAFGDLGLPVVDRGRADVDLADDARVITGGAQQARQSDDPGMRLLTVRRMLKSVLAVLMRVQAGVDGRPARAARRDGGIGLGKAHTSPGQAVDIRRANHGIPITTRVETEIVGDDQDDISRFDLGMCAGRRRKTEECEEQDREAAHGISPRSVNDWWIT